MCDAISVSHYLIQQANCFTGTLLIARFAELRFQRRLFAEIAPEVDDIDTLE
jgi:hypothetical protein